MRQRLARFAFAACAAALVHVPAAAQTPPTITLTRLACGTNAPPTDVAARFSDTYAWPELKIQLTFSCYLVRHGDDYLIWDFGNPVGSAATAPAKSLVALLAELNLTPAQVKYVGVSHYHGDHTGQVGAFAQSTLLIGKGDWDVVSDPKTAAAMSAPFANWISGGGKVEPIAGDRDVFGDGTVIMLNTPGHTPGHHSLLVRLKEMGNVLLTGDLAHFRENYDSNGVPTFNTDRAATLSSLDRFKKIAANVKATVIIQHDARDIGKLPAFPGAAK
jgi:N-acyl homoserine lactone hydrolase